MVWLDRVRGGFGKSLQTEEVSPLPLKRTGQSPEAVSRGRALKTDRRGRYPPLCYRQLSRQILYPDSLRLLHQRRGNIQENRNILHFHPFEK